MTKRMVMVHEKADDAARQIARSLDQFYSVLQLVFEFFQTILENQTLRIEKMALATETNLLKKFKCNMIVN
jgi:hypothetical protein